MEIESRRRSRPKYSWPSRQLGTYKTGQKTIFVFFPMKKHFTTTTAVLTVPEPPTHCDPRHSIHAPLAQALGHLFRSHRRTDVFRSIHTSKICSAARVARCLALKLSLPSLRSSPRLTPYPTTFSSTTSSPNSAPRIGSSSPKSIAARTPSHG